MTRPARRRGAGERAAPPRARAPRRDRADAHLGHRSGSSRSRSAIDDPATREAIAELGRQVAPTMQDVRRIALELRPKVLDDYGLVSALERLTSTFSTQTGIQVDLEAQLGARSPSDRDRDGALPDRPGRADERGQARRPEPGERASSRRRTAASCSCSRTTAAASIPAKARNGGLGLEGMRERVELLEGRHDDRVERGAPGRRSSSRCRS